VYGITPSGHIEKLSTDTNEYRGITLSNNLQVLLIHQKYGSLNMGSMAVGVGSFNDPDDLPGIAHFVEHALFLGNQKYPEPNGFETFIAQHGGVRTAYSHAESTNYDFAVSPNSLNDTLERFATFYINA